MVYGNSLDAYSCVQTLMEMGIPGERIALVEPPLNYEVNIAPRILGFEDTLYDTIWQGAPNLAVYVAQPLFQSCIIYQLAIN